MRFERHLKIEEVKEVSYDDAKAVYNMNLMAIKGIKNRRDLRENDKDELIRLLNKNNALLSAFIKEKDVERVTNSDSFKKALEKFDAMF